MKAFLILILNGIIIISRAYAQENTTQIVYKGKAQTKEWFDQQYAYFKDKIALIDGKYVDIQWYVLCSQGKIFKNDEVYKPVTKEEFVGCIKSGFTLNKISGVSAKPQDNYYKKCKTCYGKGFIWKGMNKLSCPNCNGTGKIDTRNEFDFGGRKKREL